MSIEQHAEAAAEEIDRSMTDGPKAIIARHIQAAIDKATAPLRARIEALEGLGPLIEEFANCKAISQEMYDCGDDEKGDRYRDREMVSKAKIDAILRGGVSEQSHEIAKGGWGVSDDTETQEDRWERVGGDYFLDFASISNKRSNRPDLHAFLLLDELFPGDTDIVCSATHDEFYLDFGEDEVEKLTDEQIIELSRCGVRYSEDSLCMFA